MIVQLCVTIEAEQKKFIEDNKLSASKLLRDAINEEIKYFNEGITRQTKEDYERKITKFQRITENLNKFIREKDLTEDWLHQTMKTEK